MIESLEFGAGVEQLLAGAALPVDDSLAKNKVLLFGDQHSGCVTGVVGLERCGDVALLRSLAVAESERGNGLGRKLVAYAEANALSIGVTSLYLPTTTAEDFFARLGYHLIDRADAPAVVAGTAQFSDLCPASAAFMAKHLRGQPGQGVQPRIL